MISSKAYNLKHETLPAPPLGFTFPEFDLRSIDADAWKPYAVEIKVPHDEVYHRPASYQAYPLKVILEKWLTGGTYPSEDWELVFECEDGHALDGIGGTMGPELHTPRNITEYWKPDQLADFIKSPQAFRQSSKMPPMAYLGDAKIASIVAYLEAPAKQR